MTKEEATEIILCWKRNGLLGELPVTVFGDDYWKPGWMVRRWLVLVSKRASDCMWDGQEMTAYGILRKTAVGVKKDLVLQANRKRQEATSKRRDLLMVQAKESYRPKNRSNSWGVTKGVRSK